MHGSATIMRMVLFKQMTHAFAASHQVPHPVNVSAHLTRIFIVLFIATNTALTYEIADGVAENKFTVNSSTGLVSTRARLDREMRDSWIVTGCISEVFFIYHIWISCVCDDICNAQYISKYFVDFISLLLRLYNNNKSSKAFEKSASLLGG